MHTDLIPTAEVASQCGVSVKTIHRWVESGRIAPVAVGPGPKGARLFDRRDVALLVAQLTQSRSA